MVLMQNEWTREIERLTDLLKKSEEEMLFWRHDSRRLNKENAALKAEVERLKKPKGFHDVSDLYEEAENGRTNLTAGEFNMGE